MKSKSKYKYFIAPLMLFSVLVITIVSASYNSWMTLQENTGYVRAPSDIRIMSVESYEIVNDAIGVVEEFSGDYVRLYVALGDYPSNVRFRVRIKNNTNQYINVYDISNQLDSDITNDYMSYSIDTSSIVSTYGSNLINPNSQAYVYINVAWTDSTAYQTADGENTAYVTLKFDFSPIYAVDLDYSNSTYTTCEEVQCALDEIAAMINYTPKIICQRATVQHSEQCNGQCTKNAAYNSGDIIYYGTIKPTGSTLAAGDAFDCDVNGDGRYDPTDERFYYVSNYFDTNTQTYDTSTAVLIYSNNVYNGLPNNNASARYDSSNNYSGPNVAITHLPTTASTSWKNVKLKNTTRAIITETGNTATGAGTLPTDFSYAGYSTRLLTYQEMETACGTSIKSTGGLDTCDYFMENTTYGASGRSSGYWLETPRNSHQSGAWRIYVNNRAAANGSYSSSYGVRPVIEVKKFNMSI